MSKSKSAIEKLQESLASLGNVGTKFIPRLEDVAQIQGKTTVAFKKPNPGYQDRSELDKLAGLAPSDPYSALVLRGGKLYVAQNIETAKEQWKKDHPNQDWNQEEYEKTLTKKLVNGSGFKITTVEFDLFRRGRRASRY